MAGEGPPSTSLLITARKDVDGRPSPTMTVSATGGSPITAVGITTVRQLLDPVELRRCRDCGCNRITQRLVTMGDMTTQFRRLNEEVLPFV